MLTAIKTLHTAICAAMVAAIFYALYCGVTGRLNVLLAVSIGLVGLEGAIFFGNGRKCPLTFLAKRYGDPKGHVGDLVCPEWLSNRTFSIFTSLFTVGLVLVLVRLLTIA